jgi:hypothetical protein
METFRILLVALAMQTINCYVDDTIQFDIAKPIGKNGNFTLLIQTQLDFSRNN